MSTSGTQHTTTPRAAPSQGGDGHLRQLSPLLVWAVVFCDIGTSIYYVPGILYKQVHNTAPIYVIAATIGFLFLASKYVEICWRNPDGGGVVTVATQAFTPLIGCVGGLLITVDYFLTSAISSVAGIHYLSVLYPNLEHHVVALAVSTLLLLAIVNTIGIRESAYLSFVMATLALTVDLLVIGAVVWTMPEGGWSTLRDNLAQIRDVEPRTFLIGFGSAWLAFSGLESISQLSPAMRLPIKGTAGRGMRYVVFSVLATSPILTLFAVALLPAVVKDAGHERFISELAGTVGFAPVKLAVILTASSLLLLASNTAIIGSYHVFLALADRGFLPSAIAARNRFFGTPQIAILVATIVPVIIILFTGGDLVTLGELYAFGLLGAFLLSSAGLDVLRWRDNERGRRFWTGIMTTCMVLVAWAVNLVEKQSATFFGTILVCIGLLLAVGTRRKWFADLFYQLPFVARATPTRILESEERLEDEQRIEILSLNQAQAIARLYPSSTLIAIRGPSPGLIMEAIAREKGRGGRTLYGLYVEERTGLFVGSSRWKPKAEGVDALQMAARAADTEGMTLIPVYTVSYNAVEGILRAAESLGVTGVMIGVSQRNAFYHLLRGHVLAGLTKRMPPGIHLLIYG